jgi:WD40 repeat protein
VAFSPDSQTLALAGNGKLRLVNVANGKEKLVRKTDSGNIKALAFSPDGRTLAFGSDDQTVRLWNLSSGQERRYSHGAPIDCLAFSPDGMMVASGGKDETIKFWDVGWEPDAASLRHPEPLTAVAFSPDGSLIAAGSADTVTLWHVNERRAVVRLTLSTGKVRAGLVFSHDGNTLAVAGGHTIKLFHTDRWQEKATLEGHAFDVYNLAFSPDDRTLASSEGPTTDVAELKLWDVASGRARFTMRRKTTGSPIAFSADGRLLATGWGHVFYLPAGLTLVDVATGQERLTLTSGIPAVARAVAFSPDGTTVALVVSWGQIFLWDVHTSKLRNCLKGHTGDIDSIAFHPDGKILASTKRDGSLSLWDLATGQERMVLTGHAGGANSVAFSPDGATMASAGDDGVVKLWQGPVTR